MGKQPNCQECGKELFGTWGSDFGFWCASCYATYSVELRLTGKAIPTPARDDGSTVTIERRE